jgi:two-component system LytT family response regulator
MRPLRTIIVDDESLARRTLLLLLEKDPEVEVVGQCCDGPQAVEQVAELRPHIVFLDIQMPGMDGFDVLEALESRIERIPAIVFVTAYDEFALRAFDVHALDYLLKPFDDERFARALQRAKLEVERREDRVIATRIEALLAQRRGEGAAPVPEPEPEPDGESGMRRFVVRASGGIHFVDVDEVDWIEAAGDYVRLHIGERSHLVSETMKELEKRLDPTEWVRIHRSTIVRISCVQQVRTNGSGQYMVILEDETKRSLSRSGRQRLERALGRAL